MTESNRASRTWLATLRIGLSGCLLLAILWTVDIGEAGQLVARSRVPPLLTAVVVFLFIRTITALRWFVLLRAYGVEIGYLAVIRITFVSTAVGHFIPGGADAASIYQVFREGGKLSEISAAALLDRLFGILAMLVIANVALFVAVADSQITEFSLSLFVGSIVALVSALLLIRSESLQRALRDRPTSRLRNVNAGLRRVVELLSDSTKFKNVVLPSAITSVVVQLLRAIAFFAVYRGLGQETGIGYFFAFVPLVFVAMAIPISIGGFGVREGLLVLLFGTVGVAAEVSVTAGLLVPLLQTVAVVPGLILIALGRPTSKENSLT